MGREKRIVQFERITEASACVGSGMCCKKGPCPYGEWDESKSQCAFLEVKDIVDGIEIYQCGKYNEIVDQPGADMVPAFGAGCCMSLFNENRQQIISLILDNKTKPPYGRYPAG